MPPEDKLTRGERIRLESLNMALNMGGAPFDRAEAENQSRIVTEQTILSRAERIESWLKRADEDTKRSAN